MATTEFVAAARVQCKNLGIPAYEVVTVPHPIVPLSQEEIWSRADAVVDTVVSKLVAEEVRRSPLKRVRTAGRLCHQGAKILSVLAPGRWPGPASGRNVRHPGVAFLSEERLGGNKMKNVHKGRDPPVSFLS